MQRAGEPYDPLDVGLLFDDEPTVALRGPWSRTDLVKIGPREEDLRNRFEYHLDFPGDALDAGCDYELWTRRLAEGSEPTVYAHVATEARRPESSLSSTGSSTHSTTSTTRTRATGR